MTRADELLLLIEEATTPDGRYFVPPAYPVHCHRTGETITVSGAGDAQSLKALERRGLIRRPANCPHPNPYCYEITEDGKLRAQELA